jgi:ABC-type phosphate/phosphonate transport system substrate-binding protein
MIASLPMYDFPEVREATDGLWRAIAKRLGTDIALSRELDWTAAWSRPNLLFSQTCGYPFTHALAGQLRYVATPHYAADGCVGPNYSSILFAREAVPLESFQNTIAAFNNRDSMSGMLALQLVFAPLAQEGRFFSNAIETGGHLASLAAVQSAEADVCAIDCVTVAYARRYRPTALAGLQEVGRSQQVPGLPYVTREDSAADVQRVLRDVFEDPATQAHRDALLLNGLSVLGSNAYAIIPTLETEMLNRDGLVLW